MQSKFNKGKFGEIIQFGPQIYYRSIGKITFKMADLINCFFDLLKC